jgi:hypothetical protein
MVTVTVRVRVMVMVMVMVMVTVMVRVMVTVMVRVMDQNIALQCIHLPNTKEKDMALQSPFSGLYAAAGLICASLGMDRLTARRVFDRMQEIVDDGRREFMETNKPDPDGVTRAKPEEFVATVRKLLALLQDVCDGKFP